MGTIKYSLGFPVDYGKDSFVVLISASKATKHSCYEGGASEYLVQNSGAYYVLEKAPIKVKKEARFQYSFPFIKIDSATKPDNLSFSGRSDSLACALALLNYCEQRSVDKKNILLFSCSLTLESENDFFVDHQLGSVIGKNRTHGLQSLIHKWETAKKANAKCLLLYEDDAKLLCDHFCIEPINFKNIIFKDLLESKDVPKILFCQKNDFIELVNWLRIEEKHKMLFFPLERTARLFHGFGTIPIKKNSNSCVYIYRNYDEEVISAVIKHKLIVLEGNYQTGKSSLLIRAKERIQNSIGECVYLDLSGLTTTKYETFDKEFLAFMRKEKIFSGDGWQDFRKEIKNKEKPIIILVDEFGMLQKELVELFMNQIFSTIQEVEKISFIFSLPLSLESFFIKKDLEQTKFANLHAWKRIKLDYFTSAQMEQILCELQPYAKEIFHGAKKHFKKILSFCKTNNKNYYPHKLQILCKQLIAIDPKEMSNIIKEEKNYR